MGSVDSLPPLYNRLGQLMREEFEGWRGVVLTSQIELGKAIGLRASKKHRFHNGRLELHCLQFDLSVDNTFRPLAQTEPRRDVGKVNAVTHADGGRHYGGQSVAQKLSAAQAMDRTRKDQ